MGQAKNRLDPENSCHPASGISLIKQLMVILSWGFTKRPPEVAPELVVEEVEDDGVDAGVDEGEAERRDLEGVPTLVELKVGEVPAERVDVARQPADDEDDDEREYDLPQWTAWR